MRKIPSGLFYTRNFPGINRNRSFNCLAKSFPSSWKSHSTFAYRPSYYTSNQAEVEVQKNLIVPFKGYLTIRNSQNMDLAIQTSTKIMNNLVAKNSTVEDLKQLLKQKLNATQVEFYCDEAKPISDLTPIEAFLDRNVFVVLNNNYSVKIQGQLLRPAVSTHQTQSFRNLELPILTRREIQNYCQRANTWIQAKYGAGFQNTSVKIPKNQAKKILIQALLDPLESTKRMLEKQEEYQKMYWQVQQLLQKKSQAVIECSKMVRNRMSLGILMILGNVVFIWSGTYIFYSWDIIEPIAYFISSLAGIILCSRFFKIKRPFNLLNYKQYMIEKYMPQAMRKVNLDINELNMKKIQLAQLEAEIKDFHLKHL